MKIERKAPMLPREKTSQLDIICCQQEIILYEVNFLNKGLSYFIL